MMNNERSLLKQLSHTLSLLPGIGKKTAERLAYFIVSKPEEVGLLLAKQIEDTCTNLHLCNICCNFTENETCDICLDKIRDHSLICVVESPLDIMVMERSQEYKGVYHVLHGAISPIKGLGPENLKIADLLKRVQSDNSIKEIILANNLTLEGETTANYLARLLKPSGLLITRIAQGMPMGSNLEYADEVTLIRAIEHRNKVN